MKKEYIFPSTEAVFVESAQVVCVSLPDSQYEGGDTTSPGFKKSDGSEGDDLAKSRMDAAETYGATYGDLW